MRNPVFTCSIRSVGLFAMVCILAQFELNWKGRHNRFSIWLQENNDFVCQQICFMCSIRSILDLLHMQILQTNSKIIQIRSRDIYFAGFDQSCYTQNTMLCNNNGQTKHAQTGNACKNALKRQKSGIRCEKRVARIDKNTTRRYDFFIQEVISNQLLDFVNR